MTTSRAVSGNGNPRNLDYEGRISAARVYSRIMV